PGRGEQRVLEDVLGVLRLATHLEAEAVEARLDILEEGFEGVAVASPRRVEPRLASEIGHAVDYGTRLTSISEEDERGASQGDRHNRSAAGTLKIRVVSATFSRSRTARRTFTVASSSSSGSTRKSTLDPPGCTRSPAWSPLRPRPDTVG